MTERKSHLDGLAIGLLLACCLFWGFQQILIKTTVGEVPPLWQAAIRFVAATGLLFAAEFTCIYLGLRDTAASRLTVFLYTSPFVVALLVPRLVPSEKLRSVQWVGLVIAFAAVAAAFSEGFTSGSTARQLRGDALALAAGTLWGLTTLVIRASKLSTASAEKTLFYQVGVTALIAPLLSLGLGETWSLDYSAYAWGSLAAQTVIGAFASYLAWMWLLRHYPATQMSSFTFLTPVFALVFGVVLLHEPLTMQLVLALVGVAAGIVLVNRKPAR